MIKRVFTLLFGLVGAALLATAGGWSWGATPLWAFSFLIFVPPIVRMGMALCVIGATGVALTQRCPIHQFATPGVLWLARLAGRLALLAAARTDLAW